MFISNKITDNIEKKITFKLKNPNVFGLKS